MIKILIAADHGGYALKEDIKNFTFDNLDIEWIDLGTHSTESVDYPDYSHALADKIKEGAANFGVLICRSGIGMSIAANRHSHIRAAVCSDTTMAKFTRIDNDSNVLCIGASLNGIRTIEDILYTFLTTEFAGKSDPKSRHARRVEKLNVSHPELVSGSENNQQDPEINSG
jgi:ribose 5-phosphate isomerase B